MKHPDGLQVLIAIDQLCNTLIGGYADETISSYAHRKRLKGKPWLARLIDALFFWQPGHCQQAFQSELDRAHLPPSVREMGKNNE